MDCPEVGGRFIVYLRAPQGLGDVPEPAYRHIHQIHLHHRFLHRGPPTPVALDDCRLEVSAAM